MRKRVLPILALGLFLAESAIAANDVAITSFTANKTTVQASEDVTLTIRVKNNGPDAAPNVNFNFSNTFNEPLYPLSATAAAGWKCSTAFVTCYTESMPAGADVTLTYRIVVPATYRDEPLTIAMFGGALGDSNLENNRAELSIAVQQPPRTANLELSLTAPPNPIAAGSQVTMTYAVYNAGPSDLNDVRVTLYSPLFGPAVTFEGAGWACTSSDGSNAVCHRSSLAAGSSAPISVRFTANASSLPINTRTAVFSSQPHFDGNRSNDRADHTLSIGDAADWSRVLIPFTTPEIPGANGSLWKTEISGIIEGVAPPELWPSGCGPIEDPCGWPPLGRAFDAFDEDLIVGEGRPHFVYFRRNEGAKVSFTTRVYDATKNETTAGAFVPMARDEDFSTDGFTLLAIPSDDHFRSALRIYDANGTGGEVEVALYRPYENEPFATHAVTLDPVEQQLLVTTAVLPFYPAVAQLNLGALIPEGESRVRVSVRPLPTELPAPSMQLWGFVSITNNQTSHVSVVTP